MIKGVCMYNDTYSVIFIGFYLIIVGINHNGDVKIGVTRKHGKWFKTI